MVLGAFHEGIDHHRPEAARERDLLRRRQALLPSRRTILCA
jgi:hypothetical protein